MSNARGKQKSFEPGKRYPIARERLTVKQKSGPYQTIGTAFQISIMLYRSKNWKLTSIYSIEICSAIEPIKQFQ